MQTQPASSRSFPAGLAFVVLAFAVLSLFALAPAAPRFNMIAFAELKDAQGNPDQHKPYVDAAKVWLNQLAKDSNFTVTYYEDPNGFTDDMLSKVDLIWQLNYPPYMWNAGPKTAFEKWMDAGKGGWVGTHHATLYGSLVTNQTWPWFYNNLIGQISFKGYISKFASGDVRVEEAAHPVFAGVPAKFNVSTEEWYTYDKNPRPKVHVLANVDENSYVFGSQSESNIKMGDHPVVWTNDGVKARNIYIFMGHHPNLFQNAAYVTLLRNSLFWAVNKPSTALAKPGPQRPAAAAKAGKRLEGSTMLFAPDADPAASEKARNAAGRAP
jgi:type 1 glutamine amidotransferase